MLNIFDAWGSSSEPNHLGYLSPCQNLPFLIVWTCMFCYNMILLVFATRLSSRSVPPGGHGESSGKYFQFHVPIYHCNKTCMFIQWYLIPQIITYIHLYIFIPKDVTLLHESMLCMWCTPWRGVTGDVMKMHLANSYISFHAIPQGR